MSLCLNTKASIKLCPCAVWDSCRSCDGGGFSGSAEACEPEDGKHLSVFTGRWSTEVICCGLLPVCWAVSVRFVYGWRQLSVSCLPSNQLQNGALSSPSVCASLCGFMLTTPACLCTIRLVQYTVWLVYWQSTLCPLNIRVRVER